MNNNLKIWNEIKRPPEDVLKRIEAGRLRGKSDINPQWRLEKMTEMFGVIGVGWYYEIIDQWLDAGNEFEKTANVKIHLYIKVDGEWSKPIVGIGGSMAVVSEKKGIYTNDECYKMALTDALSVAMKQLGMAADIYRGLWDGSKYSATPKKQEPKPTWEQPQSVKELNSIRRDIGKELTRLMESGVFLTREEIEDDIELSIGVRKTSDCKDKEKLMQYLEELKRR